MAYEWYKTAFDVLLIRLKKFNYAQLTQYKKLILALNPFYYICNFAPTYKSTVKVTSFVLNP